MIYLLIILIGWLMGLGLSIYGLVGRGVDADVVCSGCKYNLAGMIGDANDAAGRKGKVEEVELDELEKVCVDFVSDSGSGMFAGKGLGGWLMNSENRMRGK